MSFSFIIIFQQQGIFCNLIKSIFINIDCLFKFINLIMNKNLNDIRPIIIKSKM